ncbi:reverse transcriptase RNA-dependent DNA polymerase [Nitzschia inconspicua]|uniref:Reverse transcriptase RNA-dependent DNA polymerase n=1 Tax=Nitzschia inconspicua TaxID=303405 RepID=A0A9K3LB07_9STRA|nr:reverse transcriptase RNA-dependent DNA polymerase [Nitzschia inconspicua]
MAVHRLDGSNSIDPALPIPVTCTAADEPKEIIDFREFVSHHSPAVQPTITKAGTTSITYHVYIHGTSSELLPILASVSGSAATVNVSPLPTSPHVSIPNPPPFIATPTFPLPTTSRLKDDTLLEHTTLTRETAPYTSTLPVTHITDEMHPPSHTSVAASSATKTSLLVKLKKLLPTNVLPVTAKQSSSNSPTAPIPSKVTVGPAYKTTHVKEKSGLAPCIGTDDANIEATSGHADRMRRFNEHFNRIMFNINLHGNLLDGADIKKPRSSQQLTNLDYHDHIQVCLASASGNTEAITELKERLGVKYYDIKRHHSVTVGKTPSGSEVVHLLRKGPVMVSQKEVFHAIYECHSVLSKHTKQNATMEVVKTRYQNITREMVNTFISMCPTCLQRAPVIKPLKGAKRPIYSNNFRDRFQIDLIDMRLFHSDSEKEFTAKVILQLLRELDPSIIAVCGRPRKPSDQGSVESKNKMVKSVLRDLVEDERKTRRRPNWTLMMGPLMAALSSHKVRGPNATSAYENVFGMPLHEPILGQVSQLRECFTVRERLDLLPDPELEAALAARLGYRTYGGDAQDAFAHSPGPKIPTYVYIDDAYADWYFARLGTHLDRRLVLPVLRALQGHPESGRLWEEHINSILSCDELQFRHTTLDHTIYSTVYKGKKVLMLRQVDDFSIACDDESIAIEIYYIIGRELQLPGEDKPPFKYFGLQTDYNGLDIEQTSTHIAISCSTYISRFLTTHGWDTPGAHESDMEHDATPLPPDAVDKMYDEPPGPPEGSPEHQALQDSQKFPYQTVLGELLYAYVTAHPDIGYHVTTLSKFASSPSALHYHYLKWIAKYLRRTIHWKLYFKKPLVDDTLPTVAIPSYNVASDLPVFPQIDPHQLTAFVDAAYANDKRNQRSTTGYAFTLAGATIAYRSKMQSTTATSSTEAEFVAAVTTAKAAKYFCSILLDLGSSEM